MKRLLFSLLLCASSVFAQTNTNVINLYSTPKLGTIFNSSQFLVTTNVVNGFTNIAVSIDPSYSSSNSLSTNGAFYASGATPFLRFTNGEPVWGKEYTNRLIAIFDNTDTTGKVAMLVFGSMDPSKNSFQMLWNPLHDAGINTNKGGEMQITFPNLALGPGWNSGVNYGGFNTTGRRIQLGIGENHHGWIDMHFDTPGNTTNQPLCDTLPLRWQLQYYSNYVNSVYPTIIGYTHTTNGDYGLTLWRTFDTSLYNGQTNYVKDVNFFDQDRYIDFFMGRTNLAKFYYDVAARSISVSGTGTNLLGATVVTNALTVDNLVVSSSVKAGSAFGLTTNILAGTNLLQFTKGILTGVVPQ